MASGYEQKIWSYLQERIQNEYGVAGLMGNLYAESGLYPDRVQGDIPYSNYSKEYTAKVDNGTISEYDFVHNGPNGGGYGLAQWTYYSRKQALYNLYRSTGYTSIGSIDLALSYLYYELENSYPGVLSVLKSATSIREASDKVLHDFENPADQSESVEELRASYGQGYYDDFSGTGGGSNNEELEKNTSIIDKAVAWCIEVAEDDTHGYDQTDRWGEDYDCSSFLITAYENAGCPVKTNGATYTGNMIEVFTETGFQQLAYTSNTLLYKGDVFWREGHCEMYIGDGENVGAHINELGEATGGETGDQTGHEISVTDHRNSGSWTYILRLPSTYSEESEDPGEEPDPTPDPDPEPDPVKPKYKPMNKLLLYSIATDYF